MKFGVRELLFVCVMLGMLAASYFFVFTKKNEVRKRLEAETARKQGELVHLKQATAGIDDLARKIDELQKAIDFFESKLPQEREMDKILTEVSQMADGNTLQTRTVRTLKS